MKTDDIDKVGEEKTGRTRWNARGVEKTGNVLLVPIHRVGQYARESCSVHCSHV
jgi:hypothetical protein